MAKVKKESWLLSQDKILKILFYLLIVLLPIQFGKHLWPKFSYVFGLRLDYLSPIIYFTDLLILIIIILSFKKTFNYIKKINKKNKLLILTTYLLLITGIIFSKSPMAGTYGLFKLSEFILLSIFISSIFKTINKEKLFIAFSIPIIYESLLAFFQILNNGSIGGIMYFLGERTFNSSTPGIANASISGELFLRPYATFSHPNVLSGFLIIYTLFLFYCFKKNNKYIFFILVLISSAAILLTLSRISILFWIAALVLLFGISIYKKYKKAKPNIIKLLLSSLVLLFLIIISFKNTPIFQRLIETKIYEESFLQRQELIVSSFQMFFNNPFFGVGLNNFYFNLSSKDLIQPVHNIFLLVLSQAGVLAFIIFIYLLMRTFLIGVSTKNIYLTLIIFAVFVLGSFDHYFLTLQQGQIILALVSGTLLSYKSK